MKNYKQIQVGNNVLSKNMQKTRYHGIAVDLDGTLLTNMSEISDYTFRILQKMHEQNIEIIVATGRAFCALPDILLKLPFVRYVVTSNGSAIYDIQNDRCIKRTTLHGRCVSELLSCLAYENIVFEAFVDGIAYAEKKYVSDPIRYGATLKGARYVQKTRKPIDNMVRFINQHIDELDSIDVVVRNEDYKVQLMHQMKRQLSDVYITSSVKQLIEVSDLHATKVEAVAFVCEMLGFSMDKIVAFGDADNDIEMIQRAGKGIAMGNASEHVKNMADVITFSNEEDGVAKMCEKIFEITSLL